MDASSFDAAVCRLQTLLQPTRTWAWIAERFARLLREYPDGLTDGIVRSSLQQARKRRAEDLD